MNYNEIYTEGDYIYFDKNKLTLKFISKYYRFSSPSDIKGIVSYDKDINILLSDTEEITDFNIEFSYNRNIKNSGFRLKLNPSKEVIIQASDERGIKNGYIAFVNQIKKTNNGIYVPNIELNHEPSLKLSGVIEGFYGKPWTLDERLDCIKFIGQNYMNTYMYAPKNDIYHRDRWRDLYPNNKILEFKKILRESDNYHVDFYYMIAPGKDFNFNMKNDYIALKSKLKQLIDIGINKFGILLDDIDYFKGAGCKHAGLVNDVYNFLKINLEEFTLAMCPTEYDIDYDTPYLKSLGENLLPDVKIFWTGNETLSHRITKESFNRIYSILNHEIIIWDNVPVNDFESDKELLFIAPYENRSPYLCENHLEGIVLNPMDIWEVSKFTLASFSQYAFNANSFRGRDDFKKAILLVVSEDIVEDMYIFSQYFRNSRVSNSLPFYLIDMLNKVDIEGIDKELDRLFNAIQNIKNSNQKNLLESIMPWILQIEEEKILWQNFKDGYVDDVKNKIKLFNKSKHKTSANIVVKTLKNILDIKET